MPDPSALRYRAFLSYSHKDSEAATYWRDRLQDFTITRPFVNAPTRFGPAPHRLTPICRDRTHFPAGHELTEATRLALDQSMSLIVLCSPAAAASPYVDEEVRYFRHRCADRPIIPVLVGPEDQPSTAMFPRALAHRLDASGAVTNEACSILAADPRPSGDGEVLATARIIGRMLGLHDHWLEQFVEQAVDQDRASRDTADRAAERHQELMDAINRDKGVPLAALRRILSGFGHLEALDDPDRAEAVLNAKAEEFRALAERLRRLTNDDPQVLELRRQAATELDAGRFDDADATLAQAEARDLAVVEELGAVLAARCASAAATRAERAAAARLRLDYRGAASHYAEAAAIIAGSDATLRWQYVMQQGSVLLDLGRDLGDNQALHDTIAAYDAALHLAPRGRVPLNWATTQNNLGNALAILGERESDAARLEQAVAAYRAALEEWTRDRVPLDWAITQNNLGNALQSLGARENGTARLEDAVIAYRAALKEWTSDRVPLNWATAQNNLGNALLALGERESGTARLEEAVTAYRAASEEWARQRVPLYWAGTQNNLGNALKALGERENGTERLKEAVSAYRAALEVRTRDRVPLDWATTQNNLGTALQTLGARESGTPASAGAGLIRLKQAVAAYRAALEERTSDRVPLDWATTRYNMAGALAVLAERGRDRAALEEAVACARDAVTVFQQANVTSYLPHAQQRLSVLEAALAAWPAP